MHKKLYLRLECVDPIEDSKTRKNGVPPNELEKIFQLLSSINEGKLKEELISFATSWPLISKTCLHKTQHIQ